MTFEDAVFIGLDLVIEKDGTVKPGFNHRSQSEIDEDNKCGHGHEAGEPYVVARQPVHVPPRIASELDELTGKQLMDRLRDALDKAVLAQK